MRLDSATWLEVDAYLETSKGVFLPVGSTEQHGPMGLIGTDAFCAELIATLSADATKTYVAPTLTYTPAPFNTSFPGTLSISEPLFEAMVQELFIGLVSQGFSYIYVVNGHGANIAPLERVVSALPHGRVRVMSWWDFDEVNALRQKFYGEWEGLHATPSEISITQTAYRTVFSELSLLPPELLSADYVNDHTGDRHGPPDKHRERFPDGRVGSHSSLANIKHGQELLQAAVSAVVRDFDAFYSEAE